MLNSNYQEQARKILQKLNYQTIRKIGKGGFGHVVLASKFTNFMNFYAIKCFSLKSNTKDANVKKYIEQQVKIMCNIDHPNVVRYQTSFQDSGWYFIVMEFCDKGNLLTYQSKMANKTLGLTQSCKIMSQILKGVQTLHSQNIIHRDIKCENIFLKKNKDNSQFKCKIGDFGFAKEIDDYTKTACGTTLFMAPQVLKKLPYSFQADIWSLGVVFYFMLFGEYPFKGYNIQKEINEKCVNGFILTDSSNLYKQRQQFPLLEDFFKRVFDLDQNRRMKLDQMTHHKLFNSEDFDWTSDSFTIDQQEEQLEWCLEKLKFIDELINDLTVLRYLQPYLLHAARFYLFKVSLTILREQNIVNLRNQLTKHRLCQEMLVKENSLMNSLAIEFQILGKFVNQIKKINKFGQGFNLEIQDFYSIKQGYRSTLCVVYSQTQKKIGNENLKNQLKLRILCCHLINRVFSKGLKNDIFPNYNIWTKKNVVSKKKDSKRQHHMSKLKLWIQAESPEKLSSQIQNINKKFYC